jgi:hypothetical protein
MAIEIKITKSLLQELSMATQKVLAFYKLQRSDLYKSIEFVYKNDVFVLLANDYFQAVAEGRRRHARLVPVEDLIKWMKKKGIAPRNGTYNTVAYLIQQSIYRNGIKARPFVNPIIDTTTDIISEDLATTLSEEIAEVIAQDLTTTI